MAQGFAELIHNVYIGLFALAVILALWLPKTGKGKVGSAVLAAAVMSIPMVIGLKHQAERREQAAKEQVLVDRAATRFAELCEGAGDKINRTVDDVDGLMLLKIRPHLEFKDNLDPMLPGAAFAGERSGDEYIQMFLGAEHPVSFGNDGPSPEKIKALKMRGGIGFVGESPWPRYRYVDAIDPKDGVRYRYTGIKKMVDLVGSDGKPYSRERVVLERQPASGPSARYAVDYEDIVNPEDRKLWIAGTIIRVIDQQTNEVLAEYTAYAMDAGMGTTDGTRAPWEYTASHGNMRCPNVSGGTSTYTRYFVDRVLIPRKS